MRSSVRQKQVLIFSPMVNKYQLIMMRRTVVGCIMCVNWLYFLLQAIVVDGSPSKQISCKYLNGTPLGEQLVSLTVAYVDIDFSKYRPQSKNISEQRMFFLQYQDGPDSWLNLTKEVFGEPQKVSKFKVFNFKNASISVFLKFSPQFEMFLQSQHLQCLNIEESLTTITFSYSLKTPSRSSYGENKQFPIILSEQSLAAYQLPLNLPNKQVILDNLGELGTEASKVADQAFWKSNYMQQSDSNEEFTAIAIPWLPFFSQCKGYGRHIYLFELLESDVNCTFVAPADVKLVQTIPTTGLQAVADKCSLTLNCFYEENVTETDSEGLKWWQSEGDNPLFFISSQAISVGDFLNNKAAFESQPNSVMFADMITEQSDDLIGVKFFTNGVFKNSIPTTYHLSIKYNQLSKNTKKIVTAQVTASDYRQKSPAENKYQLIISYEAMNYLELINTFQFDTPIYLVLFVALGLVTIFGILLIWLINKLISRVEHPPKLRVNQTFIVAFTPPIIGSLLAIAPIMLYLYIIIKVLSTGLFTNIFFMYDETEVTDAQVTVLSKGRIGLMLFISGIAFIMMGAQLLVVKPSEEDLKIIKNNLQKKEEAKELTLTEEDEFAKDDNFTLNSKDEIKDDFKDEVKEDQLFSPRQPSPTPDVIFRKQFQRAGSSRLSQAQAQVLQPQTQKKSIFLRQITQKKVDVSSPKSQENLSRKDIDSPPPEQVPIPHPQQIPQENILQHQLSSGSNNGFTKDLMDKKDDSVIDNDEENKFDIPDQLNSKTAHFETIAFLTAFFTLSLLGFSYMPLFEKNIFYFLILLQFVDAIYSWILSNYLLTESTLIQPLMAVLEVIQFVMFMAAESFQDFIISYFIRMALIISFRTYISPVLKNLKYFTNKLTRWLITRYPQTQPYLQNFLEVTTQDKNIKFYLGLHSKQQIEFKEEQSVEHVITMILSFSSKMHAIFLKPFALVVIKMFERENQIPKLYNIKFSDFDFYIYFAFVIMIPQIFIDIYVLNSLELIYGYKLYDYFHYCKYRYDFRTQKNIAHSLNLDRSISIEHRSIDNMRFTYQFYFYGTIVIFGIYSVIIGTTTIIKNNYTMYGDPVVYFHIMFVFGFLFIMQQIIQYAMNKIDPLRIKDSRLKIPLDSLEEILNPVKENLEQIMEVDIIRKHFIQLNKEWIINNLSLFITQETFIDQDEFLLKIYSFLINEEKKEEKENKRLEMLAKKQKELELKSRKKSKKAAAAITEDDLATDKSPKHESSIDELSLGINSHASKLQSSPGGHQEVIIRINRSQSERLKKLLFIWFYQAKQNLFLKSLVREVLMKNQEEHCKKCGLDIELRVVEQIPFAKMTFSFKFKTLGTSFNKYEWIRYYEKNQKFITLCLDCEIGYRSKILQKQNRQTTAINYNSLEKKGAGEKEKGYSGNSVSKSIILTWVMIARSNILIEKKKQANSKKLKSE